MCKVAIGLFLLSLICFTSSAINPPYFSQHDSRWGKQILGLGPNTISKKGCLLSTITSMVASKGITVSGKKPTPSIMNAYLKSQNEFKGTILFYKAAEHFGFKYEGIVTSASTIQAAMNAGKFAHLHVEKGTHWVLATGFIDGGYSVMDPGNVTHTYKHKDVVECAIYSYSSSNNRRLSEEHSDDTHEEQADSVKDSANLDTESTSENVTASTDDSASVSADHASPIAHAQSHLKPHELRRNLRKRSAK